MGDGMLSLSWNNHKATFCHILSTLREKERYTDVTVACEGKFYPVHKLVLSTCSEYFEKIFDNTPCKHPVVVLKDIASDELEALLSYMYDGVVSVAQNDLARLIKAAEVLKIKGLAVPDEPPPPPHRNDVSNRRSNQSRSASDDRSSPHPKRRKREDNVPSQSAGHISPISSPRVPSPHHMDNDPLKQSDTRWADHSEDNKDRPLDDRLHPSTTSSDIQPIQEVMVDETLVKEEVDDSNDNRDDVVDSGMDYGSLGSDSRLDGSLGGDADNSSSHLLPKYEKNGASQSQSQGAQPLPESVVEALAGPSGMQGWLGGCDAPGGFSGMEGYSGDSSQDMHPPQQGPPGSAGVQSQPHQMVEGWNSNWPTMEGVSDNLHIASFKNRKMHQCPICGFQTNNQTSMQMHSKQHVGPDKIFTCLYCAFATKYKETLSEHVNRHSGERPFCCAYCPYRASQKKTLKVHMRKHTGEKPYACPHCPYRSSQRSNYKIHMLKHEK